MSDNRWYLVENEPGMFIHTAREAKGYTMEEISHGICSLSTLSRIEIGERVVDYIMIEILLERMKIAKSEYEFVLDEEEYCQYMKREEIRKLVSNNEYEQAEKKLALYEKKHGKKILHNQFLFLQRALLEQKKNEMEKEQIAELFVKAISVTAPDYKEKLEQHGILSDTELSCLTGMLNCIENSLEKERKYEELYEYFKKCRVREKLFPVPYRSAMRYYAECLYENEKYEKCIQMCNEVLEELYETSKLENRNLIFCLRAKAREKLGFQNDAEREQCFKDFLTAYYVTEFYDGEEQAENLKKYIEEEYGWQFIG